MSEQKSLRELRKEAKEEERRRQEQDKVLYIGGILLILAIVVIGAAMSASVRPPGPTLEELREERFRYEAERAYDATH